MARIILSVIVSLIATVLGYAALWSGGQTLLLNALRLRLSFFDPFALTLVIVGLVLLAVAMLTVALSSVGVMAVGVIHLIFGLVAILLPSTPFIRLIAQAFGADSPIGGGVLDSVSTGIGLLAGAIFLVAGLAALTQRAQQPGALARAASVVVALIAGPMGVLLAFIGGGSTYAAMVVSNRDDIDTTGVVLLVVGAILVGLAVVTLRWSSLGLIVLGLVTTVGGVLAIVQPSVLASGTRGISEELTTALQFASPSGNLALLGVLMLAAAIGGLIRARRWT